MENLTAQQILEAMEAREARLKELYFTSQSLTKYADNNYMQNPTRELKKELATAKKREQEAWDNYFSVSMFVFGIKKQLGLIKKGE